MEFRLLGPVEVHEDGRPVPLGGRRQRTLLAHLLLSHDTAVPGDVLIERVWGDAAPSAVRASLHTYVSRLRTALGPDRLETRSAGYVLHADDAEVDAARFEQGLREARSLVGEDPRAAADGYAQALSLWRGPALGDLADEHDLQPVAARLEGLRERAVEERIAARLAGGEHAALLPELADLVAGSRLREDLWAHYVLALYRSGRQAEALAACERVRRLLADELGVEPGPALRQLQSQVLRQDPVLAPSAADLHGYQLLQVLGRGPSAVVHRALQPTVGREVALKALHRELSDDPELVHRFASAAQAAARIEHAHVLPLYDCWRAPGGAFLVLRLLRGGSLADVVQRGDLRVDQLLQLLDEVAGAVDACARQGVVHERLVPADVLLDEQGRAHVSPFVLTRELALRRRREPAGGPARALAGLLRDLLPAVRDAPEALLQRAQELADGCGPDAAAVAEAVHAAVSPRSSRPRRAGTEVARNPYKGLRAFTEADAADFFGRAAMVDRLVHRLRPPPRGDGQRLLAVVGPSGSGKSSLVRAGLVPALRAGAVEGVDRWYVVDVVPGHDPFRRLASALRPLAVEPLPADAAGRFREDPRALGRVLEQVLPGYDERSGLLLLVDQFEELYTLDDGRDSTAFVDALVAAVTAPASRVRVVLTLRADFYDRPLRHPALADLLRAGTEVVVPLDAEAIEQAVVEPAAGVGLRVEPALLAQVVTDVVDAPGALPLLQFALTELAERTEGDELTLAGYRAVGGVAGALVRRADGLYARCTPHEQLVAKQVLLQLVQPTDSGVDSRRRVLQDELVRRTDDPETAQQVVAAYGFARLLAFDRDPATRAPTVEVAHEALLREWALLRAWADAAREDLRVQRRLALAAQEWDETGRDRSFLATGARLEALEHWATRWAATMGWSASALERDYLDESLRVRQASAAAERERDEHERELERAAVRRLRAVAGLLAVAVVAASALTAFGFSQQHRAERESTVAEARALAAAAVASLDVDPERGVLLALRAVDRTREDGGAALPEAEEALHRALVADRLLMTMTGIGGAVAWGAGGLLVTEGPEDSGVVDLRDADTGRRVRAFPGHRVDVNQVAFSPDGRRLLTTGDDGAARLWDPATGRLVWERTGRGQVWGPAFSGDGRRVSASWRDEGAVQVLDVATGRPAGRVRFAGRPEPTALSYDGAVVVVAGEPVSGALVHDVATGRRLRQLGPQDPPAFALDSSPDGRSVVAAGAAGRARLWSLADGASQGTLWSNAPVAGVDWSPDGRRVVLGGRDGVARLYETGAEGEHEVLRLASSALRGIAGVAFSPDGGRVLIGDRSARTAHVWDVGVAGSREWATVAAPRGDLLGADFTADGTRVLASTDGGGLAVLDARDGRRLGRTEGGPRTLGAVRTSPDGRRVAAVGGGSLRVLDASTGAEVLSAPYEGEPDGVSWSGDGTLLGVTTTDGRLRLLDAAGRALAAPPVPRGRQVAAVAFAGAHVLVTAQRPPGGGAPGTGVVDVRDLRTGEQLRRISTDTDVLAVSPDGDRVATAQDGGDVTVWSLRTGKRTDLLVGHVGPVWDLAWSPDGRSLASSGQDATVRLWDVAAATRSLVLRGHDGVVLTVRFSRDGRRLVTSSGDGTVRVWALVLDDLVRLAGERLTRGLSADECRRYLQATC